MGDSIVKQDNNGIKHFVRWIKSASSLGNKKSSYILAILYENGIGVLKSLKKAEHIINKFEENDGDLLSIKAHLFADESETEYFDIEKAVKYFKMAAELGNREGQAQACLAHLTGMGADVDFKLSYSYCKKASKQGSEACLYLINNLFDGFENLSDYQIDDLYINGFSSKVAAALLAIAAENYKFD